MSVGAVGNAQIRRSISLASPLAQQQTTRCVFLPATAFFDNRRVFLATGGQDYFSVMLLEMAAEDIGGTDSLPALQVLNWGTDAVPEFTPFKSVQSGITWPTAPERTSLLPAVIFAIRLVGANTSAADLMNHPQLVAEFGQYLETVLSVQHNAMGVHGMQFAEGELEVPTMLVTAIFEDEGEPSRHPLHTHIFAAGKAAEMTRCGSRIRQCRHPDCFLRPVESGVGCCLIVGFIRAARWFICPCVLGKCSCQLHGPKCRAWQS